MTNRMIDYGDRGRVIVLPSATALAQEAAQLVSTSTREAVANRGIAFLALSGGSTPKAMGKILGSEPLREEVPWGSIRVFWGDERWVPQDDSESNAGEAMRGYLDSVPIPRNQLHPFQIDGTPATAAARYEAGIRAHVPGSPTPLFDLILLGMGDDGHTASLFPGTVALNVRDRLVTENVVEKLGATRLTFTVPLINAARKVAFLVGGAAKADRLHEVLDGERDTNRLPAQLVRPARGELIWLIDEAAASKLARTAS